MEFVRSQERRREELASQNPWYRRYLYWCSQKETTASGRKITPGAENWRKVRGVVAGAASFKAAGKERARGQARVLP